MDNKYANIKIEVRGDSTESVKVQSFLFKKGFRWREVGVAYTYMEKPFLYTTANSEYINYGVDEDYFKLDCSRVQHCPVYKDNNPDNEVLDLLNKQDYDKYMKEQEMKNKVVSPDDKVTVEMTMRDITWLCVKLSNCSYIGDGTSSAYALLRDVLECTKFNDVLLRNRTKTNSAWSCVIEEVFADYYAQQEQDKEKQKKMDEITAIEQKMKEMQQHIKTLKESI
jgi:hypothetical protein